MKKFPEFSDQGFVLHNGILQPKHLVGVTSNQEAPLSSRLKVAERKSTGPVVLPKVLRHLFVGDQSAGVETALKEKEIPPVTLELPYLLYGKALRGDPKQGDTMTPDYLYLREYPNYGKGHPYRMKAGADTEFWTADIGTKSIQTVIETYQHKRYFFIVILRNTSHSEDLNVKARQRLYQEMGIGLGDEKTYVELIKAGYNPWLGFAALEVPFTSGPPQNIEVQVPFAYSHEKVLNLWQHYGEKIAPLSELIKRLSDRIARNDGGLNYIVGENPVTKQPFTETEKLLIVHAVHFILSQQKDMFSIRFTTILSGTDEPRTITFLNREDAQRPSITQFFDFRDTRVIDTDKLDNTSETEQWLLAQGAYLKELYQQKVAVK